MVPLRPYQAAGIEALRSHVRAGRRRVLLQLPTGGGKTVVASAIIHSARTNHDARVLFFAHRLELVNQTIRQLEKWGVREVGVMRGADKRTDKSAPVQVGTVQTLSRRELPAADIVFVDEAHRAAGDSYVRVLEAYPEATIIGLSATPCRLDGKPLGDVFEALESAGTYSDLMADGFIDEPTVYGTPHAPDLSGVRTRRGDYAEEDLEAAVMDPHVVGSIVQEWQTHAGGRRTVVYAVTVEHSKDVVRRFCEAGVTAEHLDGTTPEEERAAILARVESGDTLVVSNCAVLTEGWDCPPVKCVVMARPTKSLALYMQCVGRALRPWGGISPIVLDHGGNVERHGLPTEDRAWSLDSEATRKPSKKAEFRLCKACFAYVRDNPCELCGFETPKPQRVIREEEATRLVVVDRPKLDDRRGFYEQQVEKARLRGFKPGFAAAQYKEKFGEWPPYAWSSETKAAFAVDEEWQRKQTSREAERAFWKEREAALAARMAEEAAQAAADAYDDPPLVPMGPIDDPNLDDAIETPDAEAVPGDFLAWLEST